MNQFDASLLASMEEVAARDKNFRKRLDNARVLVLNADFQPMSVLPMSAVDWHDAIRMIFQEKVRVVETYANLALRSPSVTIRVPSVVMSLNYVRPKRKVQFGRRAVFLRDGHQCQYCGGKFPPSELTYDHLVPRAMKGKTNWTNIVTACNKCNSAKKDLPATKWMTPRGVYGPIKAPVKPDHLMLQDRFRDENLTVPDETWVPYLHWRGELWVHDPDTGHNKRCTYDYASEQVIWHDGNGNDDDIGL